MQCYLENAMITEKSKGYFFFLGNSAAPIA